MHEMENRRYYHLFFKSISSALGAVTLSLVLIRYHGNWRQLEIDIDVSPVLGNLLLIYAVFQIISWAAGAFCSSAEFLEEFMKRRDARPFRLEEDADIKAPEAPGLQVSFGAGLLYGIGVFAISLFATVPLLAYLDNWLWIAGTRVSESASFLVFSICLFSTAWVISLLGRLISGGVTKIVLRNHMAVFFAVNGVAVLSLVVVIAVWRRYGFSIESTSWSGAAALIGMPLLFLGLSSLYSWAERRNAWSIRPLDR